MERLPRRKLCCRRRLLIWHSVNCSYAQNIARPDTAMWLHEYELARDVNWTSTVGDWLCSLVTNEEPVLEQQSGRELAWTDSEKKRRQHFQQTVDTARPQRNRATQKHLEDWSAARTVVSGLHVQMEKNEGGSTRQSWTESRGLWHVLQWERRDTSQ